MKKICIVGAGLFGTTLSLILSKNKNFEIDIFEKNNDILCETSLKNQQRFHLGYHYPRSKKTVTVMLENSEIKCDKVLVAVGVKANSAGIGLSKNKIKTDFQNELKKELKKECKKEQF